MVALHVLQGLAGQGRQGERVLQEDTAPGTVQYRNIAIWPLAFFLNVGLISLLAHNDMCAVGLPEGLPEGLPGGLR